MIGQMICVPLLQGAAEIMTPPNLSDLKGVLERNGSLQIANLPTWANEGADWRLSLSTLGSWVLPLPPLASGALSCSVGECRQGGVEGRGRGGKDDGRGGDDANDRKSWNLSGVISVASVGTWNTGSESKHVFHNTNVMLLQYNNNTTIIYMYMICTMELAWDMNGKACPEAPYVTLLSRMSYMY